ncbi:helix-turn-helix domain-containing protein [Actinomadura opuntiae]|uniref:helix-turn-helix domain-containing protein n=1 Tax=Actinomadura sp. OS1-43 TaxID=604315 RepID=UPI00255AFF23|nr:helix-turn-helix domain-containing protein [Actinomadura sp. OS1-43]MDL4812725.1 helix-turn-helix domain-containing protein [Actinomadura sp. OS1-43]
MTRRTSSATAKKPGTGHTTGPALVGYATSAQVAEYTGFSPNTLRKWRSQRRHGKDAGPDFTGQGAGVRYPWPEVERFMRERGR